MRKWQAIAAVIVSVCFVSGASSRPTGKDDIHAGGPIAGVGHGEFFDHDGNRIHLTPESILEAQRYYLERLYQRADSVQKTLYRDLERRLVGAEALSSHEQVFANASLTTWLINQVKPAKASTLGSIASALRREYAMLEPEKFTPPARMLETLKQERIGADPLATGLSGSAYVNACQAGGVPIPPTWNGGQWNRRGELQGEFLSPELFAEVYTFESTSPRGICFALPRSSGNSIVLLGIICQGNDTGNACFWDNQVNDNGVPIPRGAVRTLSQFAGGAELDRGSGGTCTECHSGENAFVIHPLSPLNVGAALMPSVWHKPLVHPDWPANPGPERILAQVPSAGSCLECHGSNTGGGRLPQMSTELGAYRTVVLANAITRTMPPSSPGNPAYRNHMDALTAAANTPPSQGPLDATGGNTIAVWRPSNGTWFVRNHVTGAWRSQQWGTQGDIPVPADYDGDGTTDFAVWRPSTGTWFVIDSSTGAGWSQQWGTAGDVPVPANYFTAFGSAVEMAVWRPSTGTWHVLNRTTRATNSRQWGTHGDVPVPGRYETIGILFVRVPVPAFTVWRPSDGNWFVQNVINSAVTTRQWGVHTDVPVPADYNGDGRTDIAIWRPSDGMWHIINSTSTGATSGNTFRSQQWGTHGDIPVPGDYDRDGVTDIAVWRPSEGNWYIIRSTDGAVKVHQWGTAGDIPVRYTVARGR